MKYPAIMYSLDKIKNTHSNNKVYPQQYAFKVLVIDEDPDSIYSDFVSKLPKCEYLNSYISDGLNHYVFRISL